MLIGVELNSRLKCLVSFGDNDLICLQIDFHYVRLLMCAHFQGLMWCNFVTVTRRSGYFLRWCWDAFRTFMFTTFSFRFIFRQRGQGSYKVLTTQIKHNMYFLSSLL